MAAPLLSAVAVAVSAAGCTSPDAAAPKAPEVPAEASTVGEDRAGDSPMRIECDRVRITLPPGEPDPCPVPPGAPPPYAWTRGGIVLRVREFPPEVVAGEGFSLVAEGGVRTVRREGKLEVEEGPFRALVLKDGRVMRR